MTNQEELVNQFMQVTGASTGEARQLLQQHEWKLPEAVSAFLERPSTGNPSFSSSSTAAPNRGGIRTFGDLGGGSAADEDGDEKSTYFTGGEKSGMLVQDPNKKPPAASNEIVDQILKKAQENGREYREREQQNKAHGNTFQGTGYKLGSEEQPSQVIKSPEPQHAESEDEVVECFLTFWKDGFSVNDGPLLKYDDPANKDVLDAINNGRAPLSLFGLKHGQQAEVKVAHRTHENYVAPKKVVKPFGGQGQRLGSHVPGESSSASSTAPTVAAAAQQPAKQLVIDPNQPATSIQLRLADGTRMVIRLNMSHRVADIRGFINSSRSGEAARSYQLQTQFPTQVLDDGKTLEEAKLANAVVFQKYL